MIGHEFKSQYVLMARRQGGDRPEMGVVVIELRDDGAAQHNFCPGLVKLLYRFSYGPAGDSCVPQMQRFVRQLVVHKE